MKMRMHRFAGYTAEDCDCRYCLYYVARGKKCILEECCCIEERTKAGIETDVTGKPKAGLRS